METSLQMKRAIMRRVYYAYALSLALDPAFFHGAALAVSLGLLFKVVYVRAIIANFAATPVGNVPSYIWHSLTGTEAMVLTLVGVITFLLLSFGISFKHRRVTRVRTVYS